MAGTAFRNLQMFGKLCGEEPASKVRFVTTMWDKISEEKGKERESEFSENCWRPMLELGARTERFIQCNEACAQAIIKQLVNSDTRKTLLQEETVELNRHIHETEAARMLYIQLQTLLRQYKATLAELRKTMKQMENPQTLADLQKEEACIQFELDKTFGETKKLKIPLGRRIQLFFSRQPNMVCIELSFVMSADGDLYSERLTLRHVFHLLH